MGARACYLFKKKGKLQCFYQHWGETRIPQILLFAPEIPFDFDRQEKIKCHLDVGYCEGAVYINEDDQSIIFYGGESVIYSNSLIRYFMALLKVSWANWDVRWAQYELHTIAEEVDFPEVHDVPEQSEFTDLDDEDTLYVDNAYDDSIVSICTKGKLKHYEVYWDEFFFRGPDVLSLLDPVKSTCVKPEKIHSKYSGFVYVDVDSQTINYGLQQERNCHLTRLFCEKWPNWKITEHSHGMYKHCLLCGLNWKNYILEPGSAVDFLKRDLLTDDYSENMINSFVELGFNKKKILLEYEKKRRYFDKIVGLWQRNNNYLENVYASEIW